MKGNSGPRLHTLDGMRGVAAIIVAVMHWGYHSPLVAQHAEYGYLAVDFFFMLSGFVIALNYTSRLERGLSFKNFITERIVRLYPIYFLGFVLSVVRGASQVYSGSENAQAPIYFLYSVILNAFMVPDIQNIYVQKSDLFALNPPAWSLFLEMLINIVFCLLIYKIKSVVLFLITVFLFALLAFCATAPWFLSLGFSWETFGSGLARIASEFSLGVLIFRFLPKALRSTTPFAVLCPLILSVVILLPVGDRWLYELSIALLIFPTLLAAGATFDISERLRGLFTFLGSVSYPIYIIHFPLLSVFTAKIIALLGPTRAGFLYIILVILAGWLVARFYDVPSRKLLRSAIDGSPTVFIRRSRSQTV